MVLDQKQIETFFSLAEIVMNEANNSVSKANHFSLMDWTLKPTEGHMELSSTNGGRMKLKYAKHEGLNLKYNIQIWEFASRIIEKFKRDYGNLGYNISREKN